MTALVIIGCGKAKQDQAAPALELYTGGYFRHNLAYARTLTTDDRILVLSGKHGLLRHDLIIAPYEQRMGRPGAITVDRVVAQARALGLTHERNVIALVGKHYAPAVRAVWPHVRLPLEHIPGGMGGRKAWLSIQTKKAS